MDHGDVREHILALCFFCARDADTAPFFNNTYVYSFNLPHKSMKSYYLSNDVIGPVLMDLILLWGYRQEARKSIHLGVC